MKKAILHFAASVLLLATNASPCLGENTHRSWKKRWIISTVALAAANFADIHSSRGLYEANPLLQGPEGHFSPGRGVAIKSAASGGFLVLQFVLLQRNPERDLYKPFALTNAAAAGITAGTAVRNYGLPRPPR